MLGPELGLESELGLGAEPVLGGEPEDGTATGVLTAAVGQCI